MNIKELIKYVCLLILTIVLGLGAIAYVANYYNVEISEQKIIIPEQKITIDCKIEDSWKYFTINECLDEKGEDCVTIPISCYGQYCSLDRLQLDFNREQFKTLTKSICTY